MVRFYGLDLPCHDRLWQLIISCRRNMLRHLNQSLRILFYRLCGYSIVQEGLRRWYTTSQYSCQIGIGPLSFPNTCPILHWVRQDSPSRFLNLQVHIHLFWRENSNHDSTWARQFAYSSPDRTFWDNRIWPHSNWSRVSHPILSDTRPSPHIALASEMFLNSTQRLSSGEDQG